MFTPNDPPTLVFVATTAACVVITPAVIEDVLADDK